MRSSLFFMFLIYKEKSHGLCQHLNQAELTLGNTPGLPQGTEGGAPDPREAMKLDVGSLGLWTFW